MGIPAICGLGEALKAEFSGRQVYIDGETGQVATSMSAAGASVIVALARWKK